MHGINTDYLFIALYSDRMLMGNTVNHTTIAIKPKKVLFKLSLFSPLQLVTLVISEQWVVSMLLTDHINIDFAFRLLTYEIVI